jgi:AsmA protein
MDLDLQGIDIMVAQQPAADAAAAAAKLDEPWSDTQFNLVGLNFFDAEMQISSAELNYDKFRFAPIALAAILNNGVLTAAVTRTGAYGGQIQGTLAVDASGKEPSHALRVDLTAVQALPLLTDVAGFPYLDARMTARIDARGRGRSQRAIMSSLSGAVDLQFQDGQIRDVNVAQMIRSLTASIMKGWDEKKAQKTDLSQLSAFFRIEGGRATTDNFSLVGPLVRVSGTGTADIGAKTLEFRLNPQLVLSLEGQGSANANPVGFGVPVVVKGTWGAPQFYPEVSGILDNPGAAYEKLRELGAGLFGTDVGKKGEGNSFMQGVESLFGAKPDARPPAGTGSAPAPQSAPQSQSGAPPPKRDTDQVRDMLRDLFGR